MSRSQSERGDSLYHQGEKRLRGLFGGAGKQEDAADLFSRAGGAFRMAKRWREAGNAFSRAAECNMKIKNKHEAATQFQKAAESYRKDTDSVGDARRCHQMAIDIFVDMGKLTSAAKGHKALAEICEQMNDLEAVMDNYSSAAEYYSADDQLSQTIQCKVKVGHYAAQNGDYETAKEGFEECVSLSLDSGKNLMRFSVPDYYLRAGLCRMCYQDAMTVRHALEKYIDTEPNFSNSREFKLLDGLCRAQEEGSVDEFTRIVREYDRISRLDPWKTNIMLKIKKVLENPQLNAPVFGGDDDILGGDGDGPRMGVGMVAGVETPAGGEDSPLSPVSDLIDFGDDMGGGDDDGPL